MCGRWAWCRAVRSRCCCFGRRVSLQLALPSMHDAVRRMWLARRWLRRKGAVQSAPLGAAVLREAAQCSGHCLVLLTRAEMSNGSRPRSLAGIGERHRRALWLQTPTRPFRQWREARQTPNTQTWAVEMVNRDTVARADNFNLLYDERSSSAAQKQQARLE